MKRISILLLSTFIIQAIQAQEYIKTQKVIEIQENIRKNELWCKKNIDESLKKLTEKKDTNTVKLLVEIAYYYDLFHSDTSVIYANKAYKLSEEIHFNWGIIFSLQNLLNACRDKGDYSSAIKYGNKIFRFNQVNGDTSEMIDDLTQLSQLWLASKDYHSSIDHVNKALSLLNKFNKTLMSSDGYIGNISELSEIKGDSYFNLGYKDSALFYYNRAYESVAGLGDYYNGWKITPLFKLANYSYEIKDYEIAIGYLKKITVLHPDEVGGLNSLVLFSKIYLAQGKIDSALKYVSTFLLPIEYPNSNMIDSISSIDAVETMVKVYQKANLKDSILKYQGLLILLKDVSYDQEQLKKLESIKFKERLKDLEIEERKQQDEKERNNNIKLGLISIFIPTFAAFVYYLSRKKKKNTKIITLMGLASLLMLFEFISLLIHPFIEKITHHDAVLMYLILLLVASLLVPLHHKLEGWVKDKI